MKPNVEPVEIDARPIIAGGTVVWLVALVLLATVFHHDLVRHHATWWLSTCGIGAGLGVYGVYFATTHRPQAAPEQTEESANSQE